MKATPKTRKADLLLSILITTSMLLMITVISLFIAIPVSAEESRLNLRLPGKLYDVGTHRMHLNCQGRYYPTVVIDSGLGGFSLEWARLQKQLSQFNRVCTYDRAGYGWSDPSPYPRTTENIAKELYQLLKVAEIDGPYLMVGHSFGGYTIRYFASEYPELVSGLIFVDASHPEQYLRMPKPEHYKNTVPAGNAVTETRMRPRLNSNFPQESRQLAQVLLSTYKARMTQLAELQNFITSARQVSEHDHLPDVPVTVITRAKRVWPKNDFGDDSERVWQELQNELAGLARQSRHVMAYNSGH